MKISKSLHPDNVLDAIKATTSHPTKLRNLDIIHTTCQEREKIGSKNFSIKSIGESAEARGGPKLKSLWNAQSEDYRNLIEAWRAYIGDENNPRGKKIQSISNNITGTIIDPATRIVVEKIIRERDMLRNEVNILKSQTKLIIDKRKKSSPNNTESTSSGEVTVEIKTGPNFNQIEREALEHSISPAHWLDEGWYEEKLGRIVKKINAEQTRTIFKPGFVSAIRKILSSK